MVANVSNTGVGAVPPIVAYSDSKEANDIASSYVKIYPAYIVSSLGKPSSSLYTSSVDPEDAVSADSNSNENKKATSAVARKAPTLMDIELVSNTVVFDAAGNPTATVVFKVRNSSGEDVKSVKAKVKIL
jgi:hypothetical protein